jgi:hypothetical protein
MKEELPSEGQRVSTAMGTATVVGSNPLKGTVLVALESEAAVELPLSEIKFEGHPGKNEKAEPKKV